MFTVIVALLIVMVALYLVTQGMLSALLALATSIFSSILAMALMEPLQSLIGSKWPDYARGLTFLLLFLVIFTITRFGADMAVPKNIKLSTLLNRITGGVIGFFVGLVVVGTMLIGLEMLPLNRVVLGFDRFPNQEHHMQAVAEGQSGAAEPILGQMAKRQNVVFAPDRLVLAIWDGVSGRALGGERAWASIHPDLTVESYGYRNHFGGSARSIPTELFEVRDTWVSADASFDDASKVSHKPAPGKRFAVVRTAEKKGDASGHSSTDYRSDGQTRTGEYIFISATQLRLVTDKFRQYYPIGYLENGKNFVATPLDVGFVEDDFNREEMAIQDWVFEIADNETPKMVELKQLGRKELGKPRSTPYEPLQVAMYPAHAYLQNLCSLNVDFIPPKTGTFKEGHVYVLKTDALCRDVPTSTVHDAYDRILKWNGQAKPGVPSPYLFRMAQKSGQDIVNAQSGDRLSYNGFISTMLLGETTTDGARNLEMLPKYFKDTILPILTNNTRIGSLVIGSDEASPQDGKAQVSKLQPGQHAYIITMTTDRGFYVWISDGTEFGGEAKDASGRPLTNAGGARKITASVSGSGSEAPAYQIDLDEKAP
jgi:hypothetical protein